jgi:hypothetical protein
MDRSNRSKRWVPLSLALLLSTGTGLGISLQSAEAKPPDHAPAWGYRCKESEKIGRDKYQRKVDCKRDARYERDDRYNRERDRDDRYDDRYDRDDWNDRYSYQGILRSGTLIETDYASRDRIVLRRNETLPLTLRVSRDVRDSSNRVVIRSGSRIEGELRPSDGGIRFFAQRLILTNGNRYQIDARSNVIRDSRGFADRNLNSTLVSEAARILLGSSLGRRADLGNVIADVLAGRNQGDSRLRSDLIVIYPDSDLDVTLRSDLRIR